jgi:hypothetical protein
MGVFDLFATKKSLPKDNYISEFVFKDNASAFEYACRYMDCRVIDDEFLPALVQTVESTKDGRQICSLLLASDSGGREIWYCETLNENVPFLKTGDIVAYRVVRHFPESESKISALSVMGFIVAKLKPIISRNGTWTVASD